MLSRGWGEDEKLFQANLRPVCHSRPFNTRFQISSSTLCSTYVYRLVCLAPWLNLNEQEPTIIVYLTPHAQNMFCLFADLMEASPTRSQARALPTISMKKILEILDWFLFLLWLLGSTEYNIKIMK